MLKIRHTIIDFIRHLIGRLFPIQKNKVFFDSLPDYADNSRALSDFLLEKSNYIIFWAVHNIPKVNDNRIHFVLKRNKWAYIYHTITSKYIFATHVSNVWANPKRQASVCLWHGTPLKKIGMLQHPEYEGILRQFRYFVSGSTSYIKIYKACFGGDLNVIVTGLPRNDKLFNKSDSLEKLGVIQLPKNKVVFYLPTFRQTVTGDAVDASKNIYDDSYIKFNDQDDLNKWNGYLNSLHIILVVKPHPADKTMNEKIRMSNIIVVQNEELLNNDIQLNALLNQADALITDFSSVFIDYMLMDRPIGFMILDLDEYNKNRGFLLMPVKDYLPGSIISTKNDLMTFFEEISLGIDRHKEDRQKLYRVYNDFRDGNNCKRVADAIGLKLNS